MFINVMGSGPDLVMLHGWSMHSGVWHTLAQNLAQHYTLHLVDLPGHGQSDWQAGDLEIDALLQQLAMQLPEQAVWMGWSLGGLISIAFAQRYPSRVKKLILMAATPKFVVAQDWPCAMQKQVFGDFATNLDVNQQDTLQRFLLLQARGAEHSRQTIRQLTEQLASQTSLNPDALHAGLNLLLQLDMRAALAEIACPVQVILGEKDSLIPQALAPALEQLRPATNVMVIAGAGHAPFISQPTRCQQIIEQFIDG